MEEQQNIKTADKILNYLMQLEQDKRYAAYIAASLNLTYSYVCNVLNALFYQGKVIKQKQGTKVFYHPKQ